MNDDFDETILDNEVEFKKRFKEIERPNFLNSIIDKSLREAKKISQTAKKSDEIINDIDRIENEES